MEDLIQMVSEMLSQYSPELGRSYQDQPFNRINLVLGFGRGFVENETDDIPEMVSLMLRVSYLDRDSRS